MRKIIIEIEYDNDLIKAEHIKRSTEVFTVDNGRLMIVRLPELDPLNDIRFKDVYEPKHAAA